MKEPKTAAVLGLLLGPLGYFYIGWRYTVASSASLISFLTLLSAVNAPSPWTRWWVGPVMLLALSLQAHAACQDANEALLKYSDQPAKRRMANFAGPLGMAVGLFFVLSEAYLAGLALALVAGFALHGMYIRAGAYLVGGAVVIWVVRGIGSVLTPILGFSLCAAYGKIRGWNGAGHE